MVEVEVEEEAAFQDPLCKATSMSLSMKCEDPSEDSSAYIEGVDHRPLDLSEMGGGQDQFLDPFDMIFLMVDTINALEDIEPLETPHESSFPHALLRASSLNPSEHSMAPILTIPCSKLTSQTVECDDGDWISNPTFNPPCFPRISEEDDSVRGKNRDVYPSLTHLEKGHELKYNKRSSHSHIELVRSLHKRGPSPTRNQTHRRIWGVSSTGHIKIGKTKHEYCESYKKKSLTDAELDCNDSCVSKQKSGVIVPSSKAGKKRPLVFPVEQSQSKQESTLFEHLDSDNSNGMDDILLDGNHEKLSRCKGKAISKISERLRRRKIHDKLYSLRALVPKISKMDKASIVADAISYVRELKRQVEEVQDEVSHLAACKEAIAKGLINPKPDFTLGRVVRGRKVVSHQHHHQIVKFSVTHMEGQTYHLRLHCKRDMGVLLQLAQAIESLEFEIITANFSTINDHLLNTFVIEVKKEVSRIEEVHRKTMETMLRFGFTYDL